MHVQVYEEIALYLYVLHPFSIASLRGNLSSSSTPQSPFSTHVGDTAISNPEIIGVDRVTPFINSLWGS